MKYQKPIFKPASKTTISSSYQRVLLFEVPEKCRAKITELALGVKSGGEAYAIWKFIIGEQVIEGYQPQQTAFSLPYNNVDFELTFPDTIEVLVKSDGVNTVVGNVTLTGKLEYTGVDHL